MRDSRVPGVCQSEVVMWRSKAIMRRLVESKKTIITLRYFNMSGDDLKGGARIWLEKEPPRSLLTWEDLVSKFVNYFFPPSKTTNLKNDITNFEQKFEETFSEACDRFKELLHNCPHHSFSELHQIDMFYNVLTQSDQDSLNATASGNLLNRIPRDALTIIENKSKVRTSRNKPIVSKVSTTTSSSSPSPNVTALTEIVKELSHANPNDLNMKTELQNEFKSSLDTRTNKIENQNNQIMNMLTNLTMQKQSPSGSGSLSSNTVANPRGDVKAITTRSGVSYDGPTIPPTPSPLPKEVERESKATKDKVKSTSSESTEHVQPPVVQVSISEPEVIPKPNPKPSIPYPSRLNDQKLREKAKNQITPLNENCSAVLLKKLPEKLGDPGKFLIPCDFPELDECLALADLGASINLMPLSVWKKLSLPELTPTRMTLELANQSVVIPVGVAEDVFVKVGKFYFPANFVVVDYDVDPRVPLILGRPFLRTARALIDVHGEELTLRVNDEAITFKVGHTSRYSRNYYDETVHHVNVIDVACEEWQSHSSGDLSLDSSTSGNPTPLDPIIASSSPSFTPFKGGDLNLEEIETYLRTPDELSNLDDDYYDTEGDILYLEKL
ncbi:reverse transcriptase domain-containing protein [Tanacetum coccineum]